MNATGSRLALLQQRCVLQRQMLAHEMGQLAQRLQRVDGALSSVKTLVTQPALFAGLLTMLFSGRKLGHWRLLGRGVAAWMLVRKLTRWTHWF